MFFELQGFFIGRGDQNAMIYETHTHYDDEAFDRDRDETIKKAMAAGVGRFVNVGSSIKSSRFGVELARKYPEFLAAVGVHPENAEELDEEGTDILRELSGDENVVAIGEIGLDYYWDEPERSIQKDRFARQIALAKERRLPVIVHSREAAADTLDIVKAENASDVGGIIHCFSYSVEIAKQFVDLGFYIGAGGVVTFKNGRKLKEVVKEIPLDRIMIETDSPYLAPVPKRGKRNTSEYLQYIIEEIAGIKGLPAAQIEEATYENAVRLFGR